MEERCYLVLYSDRRARGGLVLYTVPYGYGCFYKGEFVVYGTHGTITWYYKQPLQDFLAAVGARNKEKVKKDVTVVAIIL